MIVKVAEQGTSMRGLVNYMLGPGRAEEHTDQRVVAMSGDVSEVAVGRQLNDGERRSLGMQLGLYGQMFPQSCPQAGGVYHVVFSVPAGEHVADEQWARIAADTAKVLHLERPNGAIGSWAAFVHGATKDGYEHMHFAASLVRSDGSEVKTYLRNGYAELHDVARRAEARCGLSVLAGRDHGSVPTVSRAEREACVRRGRPEPERDILARTVRSVAASATCEVDFPAGLRAAGVLFRPRYATGGRTEVVGYSVAVRPPAETAAETAARVAAAKPEAKPIWFGGGRLGRDLTLPALRARWETNPPAGDSKDGGQGPAAARAAAVAQWAGRRPRADFSVKAAMAASARNQPGGRAWERAADRLIALGRLAGDPAKMGGPEWKALAWEAAGATSSLARRLEVDGPGPLAAAGKSLARAAQRPVETANDDRSGDTRRRMRGVASVCSAQRLGTSGAHAEGWLRVVAELARLADTMSRAAAARQELAFEAGLTAAASAELQTAHAQLTARRPAHLSPLSSGPGEVPVDAMAGPGRQTTARPSVDSEATSALASPSEEPEQSRNDGPELGG